MLFRIFGVYEGGGERSTVTGGRNSKMVTAR